jgi:hypothetical protein
MKNTHMKKTSATLEDDPLDHDIDFRKARPNPYWLGVVDRRCVRLLASDLADIFSDDTAVNEALRTLLRINEAQLPQKISAKTATAPKTKKKARA